MIKKIFNRKGSVPFFAPYIALIILIIASIIYGIIQLCA